MKLTKQQQIETLQSQLEKQAADTAHFIGVIAEKNKVISELRAGQLQKTLRLSEAHGDIDRLEAALSNARAELKAFKVGSQEFNDQAEKEIIRQAQEATALRIQLLHTRTARVYNNAQAALLG